MNQLYVYIHPLFFGFLSPLGHHRALSRAACAVQSVPISCLFYAWFSIVHMCRSQSPNSSHPSHFPPWYPCSFSTSVFLFLLCKEDRVDCSFLKRPPLCCLLPALSQDLSTLLLRVEVISSLHSVFRSVPLPCFQVQVLSIQFFMKSQVKGIV